VLPTKGLVLVVDDDRSSTGLLDKLLRIEGYVPELSHGGADALVRLKDDPRPDLVLLDIMMPGLGGFAVLSDMRTNPWTASIPVIMISARTDFLAVQASKAQGAAGILTKPLVAGELLELMERAMIRRDLSADEHLTALPSDICVGAPR
jgi:CheY-like chemotaxis protein